MARGDGSGGWVALAACATSIAGCSHGWDDFDPGAAASSAGGQSSSTSTSASTGSNASATSGSHSGSGGQGGSLDTGGAGLGGAGARGGGGAAGGSIPGTAEYVASVADCIAIAMPDPDECLIAHGPQKMTVDTSDPDLLVRHSYVRFDLDAAISGKIVDSVTLRLVVAPDAASASTDSGSIWTVSAFSRPDLFLAVPAVVGATPIAASMGAVAAAQVVDWPLPTTVVAANAGVFLGILPSIDNGVDYQNLLGQNPPRLVVEYH